MSRTEYKKICALDDIIDQEGGLSLDPFGSVHYDYRAIVEHAKDEFFISGGGFTWWVY